MCLNFLNLEVHIWSRNNRNGHKEAIDPFRRKPFKSFTWKKAYRTKERRMKMAFKGHKIDLTCVPLGSVLWIKYYFVYQISSLVYEEHSLFKKISLILLIFVIYIIISSCQDRWWIKTSQMKEFTDPTLNNNIVRTV